MKVLVIGGTGLLGSEAARELISRGHDVTALALPPLPQGVKLPEKMKIEYADYIKMSDDELHAHFRGCDGFVFAAGVDERVEGPAPIYDMFKKYNIDPLARCLRVAKEEGVKHVAICGSYFAHFARKYPAWHLTEYHPYIRSRIDQEEMAMAFADDNFAVSVLELPYIFGAQPGRKPVWLFLVEQIRGMKKNTFYTRGGTTMVTVRQVGEGLAGAIENAKGGHCYPFGYYNMDWKQLLGIFHKYMGYGPERKVVTIPDFLYKMAGKKIEKQRKKAGLDSGLNMVKFTKVQTSELFIDKNEGAVELGVKEDDIDSAIGESVKLCMDIIDKKATNIVDMKGE